MRTLISSAMIAIRNAQVGTAVVAVIAFTALPSAQILGTQQPSATPTVVTAPAAAAQQGGPSAAQAQEIAPYVVGQAKPPATPNSPMVELTLEQAIQIALDNNLDLQSA